MVQAKKNPANHDKKCTRNWYLDACALEGESTFRIFVNDARRYNIRLIISHLSVGEAISNVIFKHGDGLTAYVEYIFELSKYSNLVGNDGLKKILRKIQDRFDFLDTTDAVHLATAIREECECFLTHDTHLLGISASDMSDFCCENGFCNISISNKELKKK